MTDEYEADLWFIDDSGHRCRIIGNPHTYHGRISAWDDEEDQGFTTSRWMMRTESPEAARWIDGYLDALEPYPPDDEESAEWRQWTERVRLFREIGDLKIADRILRGDVADSDDPSGWVTPEVAAGVLGVTKNAMTRDGDANQTFAYPGRFWVVTRADLEKAIARRERDARPRERLAAALGRLRDRVLRNS